MGMSYSDIRSLPISYRNWFIDRVIKDLQAIKNARDKSNNIVTPDNYEPPKTQEDKKEDLKKIEKIFKKFS
jgi:hypothetical protein